MSIHLEQYRASYLYNLEREPEYIYDFTFYYRKYAPQETVFQTKYMEIRRNYPDKSPHEYGEPILFDQEAEKTIKHFSSKIQNLYQDLLSQHKKCKECRYTFEVERKLHFGEIKKFYPTVEKDIREKRTTLEKEFLQTIPKVQELFNEKGGAYLLEKVCHIATEIICSIGQDAEFLKRYSEEIANSPEGKTRKTINLLKEEYSQIAERFGNFFKISQLLNHESEFDLGNEKKCFFPRRSILEIKDLISEISIPNSWIAETFKSFKSGLSKKLSDLFASKEPDSPPVQRRFSPIYVSNNSDTSDSDSDNSNFWAETNRKMTYNLIMTGNIFGTRYTYNI